MQLKNMLLSNFYLREVVGGSSETQLQVGKN